MQLFKKYGIDLAILAVFLIAAGFLVAPWPMPGSMEASDDMELVKDVDTDYTAEQLNQTSTGAITALFGVRPLPLSVSGTTSGTAAVKPSEQIVSWIQYTGRVVKETGVTLYYFKNKRTNKIIELNPDGRPNTSGWRLLGITASEYLLFDGAQKYHVSK